MLKTKKHDEKSNYLLDKGMELLWAKGYNATSVNDIVKHADIPKGSFYFYFESKEDFAVQAMDKYFKAFQTPSLEILKNSSESPKQRLLNLYEFRITMLKEKLNCTMGCLACNLSNEMSEHSEAIRTKAAEISKLIEASLVEVVKEAQEKGEIKESIDAIKMISFFENAGKGIMISMKEVKNSEPIDNYYYMIRQFLD